jgi:shikimate kinase
VVRQLVNRINPKTPRHRRQRRKEGRHNAQGTSKAEG